MLQLQGTSLKLLIQKYLRVEILVRRYLLIYGQGGFPNADISSNVKLKTNGIIFKEKLITLIAEFSLPFQTERKLCRLFVLVPLNEVICLGLSDVLN